MCARTILPHCSFQNRENRPAAGCLHWLSIMLPRWRSWVEHRLHGGANASTKMHPGTDVMVPSQAKCAKHVVRVNCNGSVMKFSQGEFCIVAGGPSLTEEWFLKITHIILIGAFMRKYHIFIDGTYYLPTFNHGRVVKHPWTETLQLVPHQYVRDTALFGSQLKRKCLLYPEPADQ